MGGGVELRAFRLLAARRGSLGSGEGSETSQEGNGAFLKSWLWSLAEQCVSECILYVWQIVKDPLCARPRLGTGETLGRTMGSVPRLSDAVT